MYLLNNFNAYQTSMGDRFSDLFSSVDNVAQYIFYAVYRARILPRYIEKSTL